MNGLPRDVARAGAAQEPHHRGNIIRRAALAGQRVVDQVMRRLSGLGTAHRMNRPGTTSGNWEWRFTEDLLTAELAAQLNVLVGIYERRV